MILLLPFGDRAGFVVLSFAIAHPGVTSAIIGPRTMEQLDDLSRCRASRPRRGSPGLIESGH